MESISKFSSLKNSSLHFYSELKILKLLVIAENFFNLLTKKIHLNFFLDLNDYNLIF